MAYIDQPQKPTPGATGCVFCDKAASHEDVTNLIVHRGQMAFVLLSLFPCNNGHLMVVPYFHTANLTDLHTAASLELLLLARQAQTAFRKSHAS